MLSLVYITYDEFDGEVRIIFLARGQGRFQVAIIKNANMVPGRREGLEADELLVILHPELRGRCGEGRVGLWGRHRKKPWNFFILV